MKNLILIVLLVAFLITAGCLFGIEKSTVPSIRPVKTVSPAPSGMNAQDPIIGVWRISNSQGYDDRYRFYANGSYIESFYVVNSKLTKIYTGTWSAQGNNTYTKRDATTGVSKTFIRDPAKNTIYFTDLIHLQLSRYQGDIVKGGTATPTPKPITKK